MENPEDARQGSVLPHQDILDENPQEISQGGVFPHDENPTDAEMQHVGPDEKQCMLHAVTDQHGQGGSLCGQPRKEGGLCMQLAIYDKPGQEGELALLDHPGRESDHPVHESGLCVQISEIIPKKRLNCEQGMIIGQELSRQEMPAVRQMNTEQVMAIGQPKHLRASPMSGHILPGAGGLGIQAREAGGGSAETGPAYSLAGGQTSLSLEDREQTPSQPKHHWCSARCW